MRRKEPGFLFGCRLAVCWLTAMILLCGSAAASPSVAELTAEADCFYEAYSASADALPIRDSSDPFSFMVGSVSPGTPILVLASDGEWAHISAGGREGYVSADSLTRIKPEGEAASQEAFVPEELPAVAETAVSVPDERNAPEEPAGTAPTELSEQAEPSVHEETAAIVQEETVSGETAADEPLFTARTRKKSVNMREKPDKSSKRVQLMKKGETVIVLSEETNARGELWYYVESTKQKRGYIRSDLLETVEP